MPQLRKLDDFGKWGDSIMFDGKVYTLDSTGHFNQFYGPESDPEHYPGEENTNDDGRKTSCCELAFQRLGLDIEPIQEFVNKNDAPPTTLVNSLLESAGFERVPFCGLLADFLVKFPTGHFYIVLTTYDQHHAISVIDGSVWNINYTTPKNQIHQVWKLK